MDYQFIVFVILAIILCTYPPMFFYKQNKNTAAILSLVMFVLIFTFYGLRWFSGTAMVGPAGAYTGNWPPYVNVCPDYLTYYQTADGSVKGCINRTKQRIGDIPVAQITPNSQSDVFNPNTDKSKYSTSNKQLLCQSAVSKGLTWEGITNGDSCLF